MYQLYHNTRLRRNIDSLVKIRGGANAHITSFPLNDLNLTYPNRIKLSMSFASTLQSMVK